MPEAINSAHIIVTLIATGVLVGLGVALIWEAFKWPWKDSRVGGLAALICVLVVILAWVIK